MLLTQRHQMIKNYFQDSCQKNMQQETYLRKIKAARQRGGLLTAFLVFILF